MQCSTVQCSAALALPATDCRSASQPDPTFHLRPILSPAPALRAFNTCKKGRGGEGRGEADRVSDQLRVDCTALYCLLSAGSITTRHRPIRVRETAESECHTRVFTLSIDPGEDLGTASSPHITEEMKRGTTALLTQGGGPRQMHVTRPLYVPMTDPVQPSGSDTDTAVLFRKPC